MKYLCMVFAISSGLLLQSCSSASRPAGDPAPVPTSGRETGDDSLQPGQVAGLPPVSLLQRTPSEVLDSDRVRHGGDFEGNLPTSNVDSTVYSPQYFTPDSGIDNAAYAIYMFEGLADFSGEIQVRALWRTELVDPAVDYMALANFATGRWDWFSIEDGEVQAGDSSPYISEGGLMYCTVLLLGTESCQLDWLILGDNITPFVLLNSDLDPDKTKNIAPRVVSFDATHTEAYGSEIISWDFDFEGDGTWDVLGSTEGLAIHNYESGNYNATVRVTETSGKQGTATRSFAIIDPNNQAPVAVVTADTLSGSAPLHAGLDALASTDADGYITSYEWDFDNDGKWDLVTDSPEQVHTDLVAWGANVVTLRVTDNFYAQHTDTEIISLDQGWLYSYVDQGVGINSNVSMCVTGEGASARPCVAYADYLTKDLRFCRAMDNGGAFWGTIRYPLTKPSTATSIHGVEIVYSGIIDAPIIGMATENSGATSVLRSVTANDELGNSWKPDLQFAGEHHPRFFSSLAIINNIPVMVAAGDSGGFGQHELIMVRAADASASGWGPSSVVLGGDPSASFWDVSLLPSFNGSDFVPLLAFVRGGPDGYHAGTLRAIDNLGASWEPPDIVHNGSIYNCSLMMVDGRPALAAGSSSQFGEMFFGRSGDGKGQTWPGSTQFPDGGSPQMAVWGGLPVICYHSFAKQGLYIVQATDAQGSAWGEPLLVDGRYGHGRYSDLLVHNENLMICYQGGDNALLCASWQ